MAETLKKDGNRVDRASQVILGALNEDSEWVRGRTLREAADLSQNGQVFYRIEEHLEPAGLVQEAARAERNGRVEPRQFRLTGEGEEWVGEHAQELATPTTREEAEEMAGEAYEAAESARESVQNYRKKLHRLKGRVEEMEEQQETHHTGISSVWQQSEGTRERSEETAAAVEELQERVSRIEESVSGLEEEVSSIERRTREESEEREESLREEIEEVRELAERANRGWWGRLFGS